MITYNLKDIIEYVDNNKDKYEVFYEKDLDYCKGCGICAEECPVKCIKMEVENK